MIVLAKKTIDLYALSEIGGINLILQDPAVGCDCHDLPRCLAAVFESGLYRTFQTTAAGNFHDQYGEGIDSGIVDHLYQLIYIHFGT